MFFKNLIKQILIGDDSMLDEFKGKFRLADLANLESKYWIWSLREGQITLSASVISLKREETTYSNLLKDEFKDLVNIIKAFETTLKRTFGYFEINYL